MYQAPAINTNSQNNNLALIGNAHKRILSKLDNKQTQMYIIKTIIRQRILGATTLANASVPDIRKNRSHSFAKIRHADDAKLMITGKCSTTHYYNIMDC